MEDGLALWADRLLGERFEEDEISEMIVGQSRRLAGVDSWSRNCDDRRDDPLRDRLAQPGAFVVAAEIVTSRGVISAEGREGAAPGAAARRPARCTSSRSRTTREDTRCSLPTRSARI